MTLRSQARSQLLAAVIAALIAGALSVAVPRLTKGTAGGSAPRATPTPLVQASPTATATRATPKSASPSPKKTQAIRECTSSDLDVTVTADRPSYSAGQTVVLTLSARNTSSSACMADAPDECSRTVVVRDDQERFMWGSRSNGFAPCPTPARQKMDPGATGSVRVEWNQRTCRSGMYDRTCQGPRADPGDYHALGNWGTSSSSGYRGVRGTSKPFRLA